ncbi:MAG TPA: polymorphic toxin type 50 domain-containing protein [Rhabdochlamydiaceae bacterium]|nr:polymorphic toxin type 50 domain-containing protein [Rhabdochlamydiaceae bacterium]
MFEKFCLRLLIILMTFTSLWADEEEFDDENEDDYEEYACVCGIVDEDANYAEAFELFKRALANSCMSSDVDIPSAIEQYFPPWTNLGRFPPEHYPIEAKISWDSSEDNIIDRYQYKPFENVKKFVFHKNYSVIPQAFQVLREDIDLYYKKNEIFLEERSKDITNGIRIFEPNYAYDYRPVPASLKRLYETIERNKNQYDRELKKFNERESKALTKCIVSLDNCIKYHANSVAHFDRSFFYYLDGDIFDALGQINKAFDKSKSLDFEQIKESALHLKAQTELEAGLFADAVISLTELIEQYPERKTSYIDRAGAYFELGEFDLCVKDFIASDFKPENSITNSHALFTFSLGITKGLLAGGIQAGAEFIPSLLSTMHGLSHGLWVFAQDPIQVSVSFIEAAKSCVDLIRSQTSDENVQLFVPELKELYENGETIKEERKGEIIGQVISKYGVEIFAGVGISKAMTTYRNLKKANDLLTLQAIASSKQNKSAVIAQAIKRYQIKNEVRKRANLKIHEGKQGKHIEKHKNFESERNRSILEHNNPERLIKKFAGTGQRAFGEIPGAPGHKEIVNFNEFIGYAVYRETGERVATSWGTIHYAKDGLHIVPTFPPK